MFHFFAKHFKRSIFSYRRGLSLIETLISLTLLGTVLVPILFISTAWFTSQVADTRNNLTVAHNASQFVNTFIRELGSTRIILPNSTGTILYIAYYDKTRQTVTKKGYELVTSGSYKYLRLQEYSSSTESWSASTKSPYASEQGSQILLPSSTVFQYCTTSTSSCSSANTPNQAIAVKLSGWTFTESNGNRTFTLPTLTAFLSPGNPGEVIVSDKARQLFSVTEADYFGSATSDTNATFSFLVPDGSYMATYKAGATKLWVGGSPFGNYSGVTRAVSFTGTAAAANQDADGDIYICDSSTTALDRHTYSSGTSTFGYTSSLNYSTWTPTCIAMGIDPNSAGIALLDSTNTQIDVYADRTTSGVPAAPTQLTISAFATTPKGLTVNGRTGDYLVYNAVKDGNNKVTIYVVTSAGAQKESYTVDLDDLDDSATLIGSYNMNLAYSEVDNLLYLMSDASGRVYVISLPDYLD